MARILVVEDNEMSRDMLSRRLTKRGYDVDVSVDGVQAINAVSDNPPDLIILDMALPVIDGWEVAEHVTGNAKTRHVPIIALTAHTMAGDREQCLESGCDDYEPKPVEIDRLVAKIEQHLQSSSAGDETPGEV